MTALLPNLHWLRPHWLWALLPLAALWLWLGYRERRSSGWRALLAPELQPHLLEIPSGRSPHNGWWLLGLGWLLGILALAGPSWSQQPQPAARYPQALVIVLDLTATMLAEDTPPSRLVRARHKVLELLARQPDALVGLVAYAGDAHIVSPLTDDHGTLSHLLEALSPDLMPRPGRDTAAALALGGQLLQRHGLPQGQLLLLTGEVEPGAAARLPRLLPEGVTLSILGVGTATGAPVAGPRGLLKDEEGHLVLARLQVEPLRELARRGGGSYHRLTLDDSDLAALQSRGPRSDTETGTDRQWVDRAPWLAALLLPLAAAGFRRGWLWLLPLLWLPPAPAQALDWSSLWLRPDQQGARLWQQGDPEAAARHFDDPAWRGSAWYRAGEHEAAAEAFAEDDSAPGHYNRGNALARAGHLEAALDAYDSALALRPDWPEAVANRALVEQLLSSPPAGPQQSGDPPRSGAMPPKSRLAIPPPDQATTSLTMLRGESRPRPRKTPVVWRTPLRERAIPMAPSTLRDPPMRATMGSPPTRKPATPALPAGTAVATTPPPNIGCARFPMTRPRCCAASFTMNPGTGTTRPDAPKRGLHHGSLPPASALAGAGIADGLPRRSGQH